MLLAIDAGNTNTVFAIFEGEKLLGKWRMATDARRTADEYAVWLLQLMGTKKLAAKDVTQAIIATVVPQTLFALKTLCRQYMKADALVVGSEDVDVGMKVEVTTPSEVGADRLVNAVAARKQHGNGLIILDFGTATTFDVVSHKGTYAGGVIAPGINLSLEALHRAAAKLPNVAVTKPKRVIGKGTVTAMQSGIFYGYLGLIEGIISRIKAETGKKMKVIATGGLAPLFAKSTTAIDELDEDLTIWGLREINARNRKGKK